jgi:hypothetical protein
MQKVFVPLSCSPVTSSSLDIHWRIFIVHGDAPSTVLDPFSQAGHKLPRLQPRSRLGVSWASSVPFTQVRCLWY